MSSVRHYHTRLPVDRPNMGLVYAIPVVISASRATDLPASVEVDVRELQAGLGQADDRRVADVDAAL